MKKPTYTGGVCCIQNNFSLAGNKSVGVFFVCRLCVCVCCLSRSVLFFVGATSSSLVSVLEGENSWKRSLPAPGVRYRYLAHLPGRLAVCVQAGMVSSTFVTIGSNTFF